MHHLNLRFLLLLLIAGILVFRAAPVRPETLRLLASIVPLADFARQIGGEKLSVVTMIPPGASPHVFEPSPSKVAEASHARIFVYIGSGFEFWVPRLLEVKRSRRMVMLELSKSIPLIKGPGGRLNPHLWLDPLLAIRICRQIADTLIRTSPKNESYYRFRLRSYLRKLNLLHRDYLKAVSSFRISKYVAFHPSFSYLAKRYGLEEIGVIEEAPGKGPSARTLKELVSMIRTNGIRAVFAEPQMNRRAAEVLAAEAGVKVLLLDPIGGRKPYGSDFLRLMRHNLSVMKEAMQ